MSSAMETATLSGSLRIQKRILSALLRREFIALTNKKIIGLLILILEPMIIVGAVTTLFIYRGNTFADVPVAAFIASGYTVMWTCRFHIQRAIGALSANTPLLYHRQVKILDVFIARGLVQCLATTLSFLLFIPLIFFGIVAFPDDMTLFVYSWFFVQWYGFVMAILASAISAMSTLGGRLCIILAVLHIWLTGAFVMVNWIPEGYRNIFLIFPMVHATEMMRAGLFGNMVTTHYSITYLFVSNTIVTYVVLAVYRRLVQRGPDLG